MTKIAGLKEVRENTESYIKAVKRGDSFIVVRRSKPIFKITPITEEDEKWETVIDFTKIRKGGISAKDLLKRL